MVYLFSFSLESFPYVVAGRRQEVGESETEWKRWTKEGKGNKSEVKRRFRLAIFGHCRRHASVSTVSAGCPLIKPQINKDGCGFVLL